MQDKYKILFIIISTILFAIVVVAQIWIDVILIRAARAGDSFDQELVQAINTQIVPYINHPETATSTPKK